ncbi:glycosyltransferase [Alicyclobacillus tolerans]|uniref:glycosyltransferase n=1 Tax=Alicyclobacillus tolerans TaxID=90970 RepID=UPI001F2C1FDE|nr:glycosyltransferase [Alicyclobacillus tolerans]MCF8567611.1 glycosyltransferase [Alicyclobacillus tolerans]
MARLSVQILTRNEEQDIADCIHSVKAIADEIIVVDTGSTDGTIQLARSLGALVVEPKWSDDFAAVRNLGLDHATADWVLILDADERLASATDELLHLLDNPGAEAASVIIENVLNEITNERLYHSAVRLFRARPQYRFAGRIHEDVTTSIMNHNDGNPIVTSQIRIVHFGYTPAALQRKDKVQRNLRILIAALDQQPDEPFYCYHLGITHSQLGQWEFAKEDMMKALATAPIHASYRSTLVKDTMKVLLHLGEFEEAERFIQHYLCQYPEYPDLHYWNGMALEALGYLERAWHAYRLATECHVDPHKFVTEDGVATFRAHQKMGDIALRMNRVQVAHEAFNKALDINPQFEPGLVGYADTLHRFGMDDKDILNQLHTLCHRKESYETWRLAKVMYDIGAFETALDVMNTIADLPVEMYPAYYECLMYNRRYAEAADVLVTLLKQWPVNAPAGWETLAIDLTVCHWEQRVPIPTDVYGMLATWQADFVRRTESLLNRDPSVAQSGRHDDTSGLLQMAIERMVHFGLLVPAETLSTGHPEVANQFPLILYKHGFSILAANKLLDVMKKRELSPSELCTVAEVLMEKGHFEPALGLFEEAVTKSSEFLRAHAGASRCYLRLALDVVVQGLKQHPNHPILANDQEQIQASLYLTEGLLDSPPWSPAQRRNQLVRSIDFVVHDREK